MHDQHPTMSYVDLNRSGVALMEIVSRPDMRSPAEAGAYVRKLRTILRYVGSCDGNMEEGSMRADVNVSVRKPGDELGTRTETKNVNSVRFVMADDRARGAPPGRPDRGRRQDRPGNPAVRSRQQRDPRRCARKEDAHDYRYFPDPDLLPLELDDAFLDECRASLPELPDAKRRRYDDELGLSAYNAEVLTAEVETARWFEALLLETATAQGKRRGRRRQAGGQLADLGAVRRAQPAGHELADIPVGPAQAAELLALVADGTISGSIAKQVFEKMLETGDGAAAIVEREGLKQTSDTGAIEAAVDQGPRRQRRQGRAVQGRQGSAVRLLRRPDDEGDAGQGATRRWSTKC